MRNWATRIGAALIAALLATPVFATPPQVIHVEDQLFARNADTLFLLRRIIDNHGLHLVQQTDTLLIARSLSSGDDQTFHGVSRVIDYGPDGAPRVETLPLAAPANPYDVFADFGAWPVHVPDFWETADIALDATGFRVTAWGSGEERIYALSLDELTRRVTETLQAGRDALPLHRVGGGIGPDPYGPGLFDIRRDCIPGRFTTLFHAPGDPALAQLVCEEPRLGQTVRLWMLVPRL